MMMRVVRPFFLMLLLLGSACHKNISTELHFKVQSNRGEIIPEATIKLDDQELGVSDAQGRFVYNLEAPLGQMSRIEVSKDSDTYYYAPYFEKISFDGTTPPLVDIKAILYFVPKPQLDQTGGKALAQGEGDDIPLPESRAETKVETKAEAKAPSAASSQQADASPPQLANVSLPVKPAAPPANDQVEANAAAHSKLPAASVPTPAEPGVGLATQLPQDLREPLATPTPEPAPEDQQDLATQAPLSQEGELATAEAGASAPLLNAPELTPAELLATKPAGEGEASAEEVPPTEQGEEKDPGVSFTLHITDHKGPVADAEVYLGRQELGDLKPACTSNARGRCLIRLPEAPTTALTFMVKKQNYLTASATTRITPKGSLKVNLQQGKSLDIFALTKSYQHTRGLAGIEVRVGGRRVGKTDQFGHFTYLFAGASDELLQISLVAPQYLPEEFKTDFVATPAMSLVRYFTPKQPPAIKIAILDTKLAGTSEASPAAGLGTLTNLTQRLRQAAQRHLFSSQAFAEYPLANLQQKLTSSRKSLSSMAAHGWEGEELKGYVDALLQPTLVQDGASSYLELSFIDSRGQVIAAADTPLSAQGADVAPLEQSVAIISQKIKRIFPFEGSVLSHQGATITLNIGKRHERALQAGDYIDLYGTQVSSDGSKKEQRRTAAARVEQVGAQHTTAKLLRLEPRSVLSRGDLIVIKQNQAPRANGPVALTVEVNEKTPEGLLLPLRQANLYHGERWLGASDAEGRLYLPGAEVASISGPLRVVKHGFAMANAEKPVAGQRRLGVVLERQLAFLRVESHPSGAEIFVDQRPLGRTPLASPLAVPSGFVKLEIKAPAGYKSLSRVLELDEGTLDLSGAAALHLEVDYLALAERLLAAGKVQAAIAKLADIDPQHSDYLMAQHQLGEVYLNRLHDPKQAAQRFANVTANPQVQQYQDKRFISSHINQAIALFLAGEADEKKAPQVAIESYQKALAILSSTTPYLRFIAKADFEAARETVSYHNALALHRLWTLTKDQGTLQQAYKQWRTYIQESTPQEAGAQRPNPYLENAQIYYKQARAQLGQTPSKDKA